MNDLLKDNQNLIMYLISSLGVIITLVTLIQVLIKISLKKRTELIERIKETETVETRTPLKKSSRTFKKQAKENLRERFSIFKRVTISITVIYALPIIVSNMLKNEYKRQYGITPARDRLANSAQLEL